MSASATEGTGASARKYIAVAGNIGVGKSTLTKMLSSYFGWEPIYERVDDNPYLSDFYTDMKRWSFNLQVFFLSSRFALQRSILESPRSVVQDRSIYEDAEIFARNLYDMGMMSRRDYDNYRSLYDLMTSYLKPPDLLIFLHAPVPKLVEHIQSRSRQFETGIRIDYLQRLNYLYDRWIANYEEGPRLAIDTGTLDFVNVDEDRATVLGRIESRLFGLFPE